MNGDKSYCVNLKTWVENGEKIKRYFPIELEAKDVEYNTVQEYLGYVNHMFDNILICRSLF